MHIVRVLLLLSFGPIFATSASSNVQVQAPAWSTLSDIKAQAYVLMDYQTNTVLASHNANTPLPPASLTKLLTSYIIAQQLESKAITPKNKVKISANAWSKNFPDSSKMFIEVGKYVSVEDLHRGIAVSSGNDAAVAMAEYLAGSVAGFSDMMNVIAQQIGMHHSVFKNPHGLHETGHQSTAYDMALLSKAFLSQYPIASKLHAEKSYQFNSITQYNRNSLLWDEASGVDFGKTGYVSHIGFNLAVSAQKNGMRLVAVIFGAKSDTQRKQEAKRLLTWGFNNFETVTPYTENTQIAHQRVWFGQHPQVKLGIEKPISITLPKAQIEQLKANYVLHEQLKAPLSYGTTVGEVNFSIQEKQIASFPLVALENVQLGTWSSRLWDKTVLLFHQIVGRS